MNTLEGLHLNDMSADEIERINKMRTYISTRKIKGLMQDDLGELLNIDYRGVSAIERKYNFKIDAEQELAYMKAVEELLQRKKGEITMSNTFMPELNDDQYVSLTECIRILRISKIPLYRLIKEGTLPAIRAGYAYRIRVSVIRAFIEQGGAWVRGKYGTN